MPRYKLRTLLIVLAIGPPAIGLWSAFGRFKVSNCGGNNAALTDVHAYTLIAQLAADESPNGEFDVTLATPAQRLQLAQIAQDVWLGDGQLLVSKQPYHANESKTRRIVAVCNRPFTNVPRYIFGTAPPTYAAGFSDGSTALLTAKEFAAIDWSEFVPLNELINQSN